MTRPRLGEGYDWPVSDLEIAWARRMRDLDALESVTDRMPPGPHRDVLTAFLAHRAGQAEAALETVQRLVDAGTLDPLWYCRLTRIHGSLLHDLGLAPQALQVRERGILLAREVGNPICIIGALHDRGVSLERVDGVQAQQIYLATIDLVASVTGAPPYAVDELEVIRAVSAFNLHLLSDRTGLPLPVGSPGLAETQHRVRDVCPTLSATIQAFRGLVAYDSGDTEAALGIVRGLPDPLGMRDVDHAVVVATAVAAGRCIEGRHEEALTMLDALAAAAPAQYLHEILDAKASVFEEAGDYRRAYETAREMNRGLTRLYGEEARAAVRALEVFHRTDEHRAAAEAARKQSEFVAALAEQWRQDSLHDPLTGVWNRRYLERRIDELSGTTGHQVAVVDLDRFKTINDSFGHTAGDTVLREVATALSRAATDDDICVRYGGDEFCILREAGAPGSLAADLAAVTHPGRGDGAAEVTLSIGVAVVDEDGFAAAFARADEALYRAKRSGGESVSDSAAGAPNRDRVT